MGIYLSSDNEYPKLLKKIGKDAPKQLYYKGNWPARQTPDVSAETSGVNGAGGDKDIFADCLAVVGSRQMTTYGRQVVERIVSEVAAAGITIVSGFMYGVDAAAHRAALSVSKGRTIAVMPCGIDLIHPEYQQDLYAEILKNDGLVISEYEGSMQPANWTYPRRNRIVAGLSKATLVVEAGEKSGSLITANFTKKFKRKLFVVPGPITSENSKGIMQLIKEGATPISSAGDILKYFKIKSQIPNSKFQTNPKSEISNSQITIEQKIIEQLKREPLEIDGLARNFGVPVANMGVTLSMMQLRGQVKQEGTKYYVG